MQHVAKHVWPSTLVVGSPFLLSFVGLTMAGAAEAGQNTSSYTIIDLGPSHADSRGMAINATGQVAGLIARNGAGVHPTTVDGPDFAWGLNFGLARVVRLDKCLNAGCGMPKVSPAVWCVRNGGGPDAQ